MIAVAIAVTATVIGVMDASFCPKSGKRTYGLDWFYLLVQKSFWDGYEGTKVTRENSMRVCICSRFFRDA